MTVFYIILVSILFIFGFVVFCGAPYVPSQKKYVRRAFEKLYPLSKKDVLLDIGSGGGIILRLASKYGAKAVGYELNPILVAISSVLSAGDKRVKVKLADFWLTKIPDDTTVIYLFAVTRDINKIINKIQLETNRIGRKLNVISYGNQLTGQKEIGKLDAYYLYQFNPLQSDKPQV